MGLIDYKVFRPLPSYNFYVFIQMIPMGFSRVSSIEYSIETEAFAEGGVNTHVYSLRKPQTAERSLVLERGVMLRPMEDLATDRFRVGSRLNTDVMILVMDRNRVPYKLYMISGAVVKRWSTGDLDALSGNTLIERFELAYEQIEILDYAELLKRGVGFML